MPILTNEELKELESLATHSNVNVRMSQIIKKITDATSTGDATTNSIIDALNALITKLNNDPDLTATDFGTGAGTPPSKIV